MSRLLKDCLKECCKKQTNICDIIDGLDKAVEDIDCAKKVSKEIEKAKKEIEAKTEEAISEAKEELLELLNKIDSEKWVIGEYKWMPVGSKMPEGWIKVELSEGKTLVVGTTDGETLGKVQVHQHYHDPLWDDKGSWVVRNNQYNKIGGTLENDSPSVATQDDAGVALQTADHGENLSADQKENLAAGKFAELWQYVGINNNNQEIKKIIEKTIALCLEKSK